MTGEMIPYSDAWAIDGNKGFFVDIKYNSIYKVDIREKTISYISIIPQKGDLFRACSYCNIYGEKLICLPNRGSEIVIFNINDNSISRIPIIIPDGGRLCCANAWLEGNKLSILSSGLCQILEIDLIKEVLTNRVSLELSCNTSFSHEICRIDDEIYAVSFTENSVFEINLVKWEITEHHLNCQKEMGLRTIAYDGECFWLTGKRKEIYIWNKENNELEILSDFPSDFGFFTNWSELGAPELDLTSSISEYPIFDKSYIYKSVLWLIPWKGNSIVTVNLNTRKIHSFFISGEEENKDSLNRKGRLSIKYLYEYIRNKNVMGFYSTKNQVMYEIDLENKSWVKIGYSIRKDTSERFRDDYLEMITRNEIDELIHMI